MSEADGTRVFISYARKDGAKSATNLREWFTNENLSVWQDLIALEGGRDWWSQIEKALKSKSLQHFVLIVTPGALESPVVRREIRLARQEGKTVSPVKGPGLSNLKVLPRWLGHIYDLSLPEQRKTLIHVLKGPSTQKRVAMMAPEPPPDFVRRPVEFGALKQRLLDAKGDSVAITAALQGAGGYGKTTLAKALAHDEDIEDAYFDGILWIELGEKQDNLLSIISDLVEILAGERPGLQNVTSAAAKLAEALGDRRILLIIDDVWREQDLRPLLQGGPNATRLITTRNDHVLPDYTARQSVDEMRRNEALELLTGGLPKDELAGLQSEIVALAARLGEWAQLLKILNGFLRDRVLKNRQPLARAIARVNQRLTDKGLQAFDAKSEADRTKTIGYTIQVSLDLLDAQNQARFAELGVFPEDVDIPTGIVARLWKETGEIDTYAAEDLLSELSALSLLQGLDLDQGHIRLHDNVRRFLQEQAGTQKLVQQHTHLTHALELIGRSKAEEIDALSRRYFYLYMPQHLAAAGEREKLKALLLDANWLAEKLGAIGNPQALVADYEQCSSCEAHELIGRTLRLVIGILSRDERQLFPQLIGRLMNSSPITSTNFLEKARSLLPTPSILVIGSSLTPPGAEIARLQGHTDLIAALSVLPDNKLASGSWDRTIRLWEIGTGVQAGVLRGHTDRIEALAVLPNGRLASASWDGTVRLWNVSTGTQINQFEGHTDRVTALAVLSDGRLASGSYDRTVRLWDVDQAAQTATFEFPEKVHAVTILSGHCLASYCGDGIIYLYDLNNRRIYGRLRTYSGSFYSLGTLPGNRLASCTNLGPIEIWNTVPVAYIGALGSGYDCTGALVVFSNGQVACGSEFDYAIRIFDGISGTEIVRLSGHEHEVSAICALPNTNLASGDSGGSIRIWQSEASLDVSLSAEPKLEQTRWHEGPVQAICVLSNGDVVTGGWDQTIRTWRLSEKFGFGFKVIDELNISTKNWNFVNALVQLTDGRVASGLTNAPIYFWDLSTKSIVGPSLPHGHYVESLVVLHDGRLASGSDDKTIRIWDPNTGTEVGNLVGHTGTVLALAMLPNGILASGSDDATIRLWDLATGKEVHRLAGHEEGVRALAVLPKGKLASASYDGTIRLWDIATGAPTGEIWRGAAAVTSLCLLPDGRVASGDWANTVRIWGINELRETARLELDARIHSLKTLPDGSLVAGDQIGRIHRLQVIY